jgi:N-acylglucosamine-6-phosphate 2-epimerase
MSMDRLNVLTRIKGGLIVSCQALKDEPLHSPYIMSKMALAAKQGGAVAIRANGCEDIKAIKNEIDLPVLGLVKRDYNDSQIYITPTLKEIDEIVNSGADIVALDATNRIRPQNVNLEEFFYNIKEKYPDIILMADVSNYDEGVKAEKLGFDVVSTTLSGYTDYTKVEEFPNFKLMEALVRDLKIPVIAEGGIWTTEQLKMAIELGSFAVVIGTAITRPREITERFVSIIKK